MRGPREYCSYHKRNHTTRAAILKCRRAKMTLLSQTQATKWILEDKTFLQHVLAEQNVRDSAEQSQNAIVNNQSYNKLLQEKNKLQRDVSALREQSQQLKKILSINEEERSSYEVKIKNCPIDIDSLLIWVNDEDIFSFLPLKIGIASSTWRQSGDPDSQNMTKIVTDPSVFIDSSKASMFKLMLGKFVSFKKSLDNLKISDVKVFCSRQVLKKVLKLCDIKRLRLVTHGLKTADWTWFLKVKLLQGSNRIDYGITLPASGIDIWKVDTSKVWENYTVKIFRMFGQNYGSVRIDFDGVKCAKMYSTWVHQLKHCVSFCKNPHSVQCKRLHQSIQNLVNFVQGDVDPLRIRFQLSLPTNNVGCVKQQFQRIGALVDQCLEKKTMQIPRGVTPCSMPRLGKPSNRNIYHYCKFLESLGWSHFLTSSYKAMRKIKRSQGTNNQPVVERKRDRFGRFVRQES